MMGKGRPAQRSDGKGWSEPRDLDPSLEAWKRQPRETVEAFTAFDTWLHAQRREDEHGKILPKMSRQELAHKLERSYGLIYRWSREWRWEERRLAWDREQQQLESEERRRAARKMAERHAALATTMQSQIVKRLQSVTEADIRAMKWHDLARIAEVATIIERKARGEPDPVAQDGYDPPAPDDGGEPDPERIAQILDALRQAGKVPPVDLGEP